MAPMHDRIGRASRRRRWRAEFGRHLEFGIKKPGKAGSVDDGPAHGRRQKTRQRFQRHASELNHATRCRAKHAALRVRIRWTARRPQAIPDRLLTAVRLSTFQTWSRGTIAPRQNEGVQRLFTRLTVKNELEPVRQERLQHRPNLF